MTNLILVFKVSYLIELCANGVKIHKIKGS